MSEPLDSDLRARIARVTWISHRDRQLAQLGMIPSECADIPVPDWAYAIADAVIREFGLRQEWLTEESSRLGIVALTEPEHPIATRTSSSWIAQEPSPRRLWDVFAEADAKTE